MASRLLFQSKFFGVSRSASLIGAHASAARAGAAPPARYFNVFPRSSHPGFPDFAKVVKRTFSWSASKSNNHKRTFEVEPFSVSQQIKRDVDTTIVLMAFSCIGILYMVANESKSTDNSSSRCSNCRNCPCQQG